MIFNNTPAIDIIQYNYLILSARIQTEVETWKHIIQITNDHPPRDGMSSLSKSLINEYIVYIHTHTVYTCMASDYVYCGLGQITLYTVLTPSAVHSMPYPSPHIAHLQLTCHVCSLNDKFIANQLSGNGIVFIL